MCLFVFGVEACVYDGKENPWPNIIHCERQVNYWDLGMSAPSRLN